MKQKITLFFLLLTCSSALVFGQTMVNDFETGHTPLLNVAGSITAAVVANPNATGLNTTGNCLEIKRTGAQWWALAGVDVADMAISDTETKYLSFMFHAPAQTDLGIRFDATDDAGNGTLIVRPLNSYTDFNQWQQMIFEIKDGPEATAFTLGTLFRMSIHPDMGFENDPAGQVLNETDAFGYIDQIQILDANPLSTRSFELESTISLYPNPAQSSFKLGLGNNIEISDVSIYNILGKKVQNVAKINVNEYDVSNLSTGLYLVKITDDNGALAIKKLYKR